MDEMIGNLWYDKGTKKIDIRKDTINSNTVYHIKHFTLAVVLQKYTFIHSRDKDVTFSSMKEVMEYIQENIFKE